MYGGGGGGGAVAYWIVAIESLCWDLRSASLAQLGAFGDGDDLSLSFAHREGCGCALECVREQCEVEVNVDQDEASFRL